MLRKLGTNFYEQVLRASSLRAALTATWQPFDLSRSYECTRVTTRQTLKPAFRLEKVAFYQHFVRSTTPILAEGCAGKLEIVTSTTPIPAEGRAGTSEIVKSPQLFEIVKSSQFLGIDHANPAEGVIFAGWVWSPPRRLKRLTNYFRAEMSRASLAA